MFVMDELVLDHNYILIARSISLRVRFGWEFAVLKRVAPGPSLGAELEPLHRRWPSNLFEDSKGSDVRGDS